MPAGILGAERGLESQMHLEAVHLQSYTQRGRRNRGDTHQKGMNLMRAWLGC